MHNIQYFSYPITRDKKKIEQELNDYVKRRTYEEDGGGLYSPIRWEDRVFCDIDGAKGFLESQCDGWYDNLAVQYFNFKNVPDSKRLTELKSQLNVTNDKIAMLQRNVFYSGFKAQYISCKECGSKLNKECLMRFGGRTSCPVCGKDMRPEPEKERLSKLMCKKSDIQKMIKEEERKLAERNQKKADVCWLVRIEYHT